MNIATESELLKYKLLIGMAGTTYVSNWAQFKIANEHEFPDLIYDLSLSSEKGQSEASRILNLLGEKSDPKEAILILFKELLELASLSFGDANKVASYLFNLGNIYLKVNGTNITFFKDVFCDADLGLFSEEETQKELINFLSACVTNGVETVEVN